MLKRLWLKLPLVAWGVKKKKVAVYELTFFAQSILVDNNVNFSDEIRYPKKVN